ncbi:MAG: T9SS type A sorting domain-containing protein [candidate division Zixibacteria bacterium]|nr:T9SS type A sorting domain-containing protein [candidate division Zixibacteria bacterium]
MKTNLTDIPITGAIFLLLISAAFGGVTPTNIWVDFYGSATTYNGKPIPVGSIIEAYAPGGIFCGMDTVSFPGRYGFMPVYGDDQYSSGIYEGAGVGEAIVFAINGRPADYHGPDNPIWDGFGSRHELNLSALAAVGAEIASYPSGQDAVPGDTIRYSIVVRNTGEGLDFHKIVAQSSNGWTIKPKPGFSYVAPNATDTLYFDLYIPTQIPYDTSDIAAFRVNVGMDTSIHIESAVITRIIMTDIPEDKGLTPSHFILYQNYPNPFNPATTIAYDLPVGAKVTFEIYDLLGKKVQALDLGFKMAGPHSFGYSTQSLASGVYFYRLKAARFSSFKKMMILK